MVQIICFFSPAFLAADLFEKKQKQPFTVKQFITVYIIFQIIINLLCLSVVAVVFHHPDYVVNSGLFNIGFSFKYLLLCFSLAADLPVVYEKAKTETKKYWSILKERKDNQK